MPELVLNLTALLSTSFLAWHIVRGYSSSTIRRVGPPAGVMRIYKVSFLYLPLTSWVPISDFTRLQFFLVDSMFLQLCLFFTVTAISLWVDQLRNSSIAMLARRPGLYYSLFIGTVVVSVIPNR